MQSGRLISLAPSLFALAQTRAIATCSSALSMHAPTYTYASPGSSLTEPGYFAEGAATGSSSHGSESHAVASMQEPAHRVKPSKKASMLKVLSTPRRKLQDQGTGMQMLPPGCSLSDPKYSVKDPVYFIDN